MDGVSIQGGSIIMRNIFFRACVLFVLCVMFSLPALGLGDIVQLPIDF